MQLSDHLRSFSVYVLLRLCRFMKRDKSLHQGKYLKKDKRKRDKVLEEDESDEEDVSDDFAG